MDVLDIVIVGYLFFRIYKILRGSVAFNIFIGVVLLYLSSFLVRYLGMDLLTLFIGEFASIGLIILVVIFQPELRKFLLLLGNTTLKGRNNFISSILERDNKRSHEDLVFLAAVLRAVYRLSEQKTGALIVFAGQLDVEMFSATGVKIDARISQGLLESIFNKESPLHDGAVIIHNNRIQSAGCVLPLSDSKKMPKRAGLRHRAALGLSEESSAAAIVVSEENGSISMSYESHLYYNLTKDQLEKKIKGYLRKDFDQIKY